MKKLLVDTNLIQTYTAACDYCDEIETCYIGIKVLGNEDGEEIHARICKNCVKQLSKND